MKVAPACRLFGHCRQAYYQSKADIGSHVKNERLMLDTVREIRGEDPGIGGYKLWIMLTALFGERFMPGGDSFYTLLRRHRLMLPPRKARGTTNSNHRYHKWKNLIKGFVPTSPNQLWVSDITYIPLAGGDVCYLHLVTDAYSHKIVGWVLADSLRASATLEALRQAIDQAVEMTGSENLEGLIHHSDRGV
ncbi:DDE-type integrase/transposase/recombinase, partial [Parabacteroides distasonis]